MNARIEHKLRLEPTGLPAFFEWLRRSQAVELYVPRRVTSTYFDNNIFQMYHETVEGLVPRKKIRLRCYADHVIDCTGDHRLEIKESTERDRLKESTDVTDFASVLSSGLFDRIYGLCTPKVTVTYLRSYFQLGRARLTLDRDIRYSPPTGTYLVAPAVSEPNFALEVKAPIDYPLDDILNDFPLPRVHFSKYERAIYSVWPQL